MTQREGYAPGHRTKRIFFTGGWHRCECGELLTSYEQYWRHQRAFGWTERPTGRWSQ